MTAAEFQQRHPKPWRFVMGSISFSLRDANNTPIASLRLGDRHPSIPQHEWNRHVAGALKEHIECISELPPAPEKIAP